MSLLELPDPKRRYLDVVSDSWESDPERLSDGKLLTNGGRVLGVTSIAETLEDAIKASYAKVEKIHFGNAYYRHDIGQRALCANKEK